MRKETVKIGKKGRSGFTLVELVLASTLTALILGSALASLSTVLKAYKELG
ncbi:MAG: PulJ/GspJ family protein, partial [Candidatus Hinthialibacter sp.]